MAATVRWARLALAGVIALALVAIGGAAVVILGIGSTDAPAADSVDAGFARDMSTHHQQAVLMAGIARDRTTDPEIALVAKDIEALQNNQLGRMQGWLSVWGLERASGTAMSWLPSDEQGGMSGMSDSDMAGGAAMPGMADTDELLQLRSATGPAFDVLFLQLMIRHHQGGTAMASYAADYAEVAAVRTLARSIAQTQGAEIATLTDMLTARGGTPLPAP